jgi:uncharacterized RDD family membrane protein YckC
VIGIILVPFLAIGLWIMGLFGKAVALAWLGHRLLPRNQSPEARHTVLAVLTGGVIITALYLVPVLGFVVYKGFDILGFGIVAYTLLQVWRATRAESAPPPAATAAAGAAPAAPRITPDAASQYPRAGFWLRMAALLIDLILVGVVCRILHVPANGSLLVILAGYGAIMWKLRGATVGSIVCNLRVVREDGRELDWPTVVVRALGCFLSFVVAGLGFLWIVFDGQRQGWHDKIAGTVVVRVPKPRPLV